MRLVEYDGTKGKTVREKIVSIVRTRTRKGTPPVADLHGVFVTLSHSHVMDPETDPGDALYRACERGELVRINDPPGRRRPVLGLPTPGVFRYALGGDPGEEYIRERIREEAETHARKPYIGGMNQLLGDVVAEAE